MDGTDCYTNIFRNIRRRRIGNSREKMIDNKEDQKIIKCDALIANKEGKVCGKTASYSLNFLDENNQPRNQNVCKTHFKVIENKKYREFKSELLPPIKKKVVRPKFIDLIDEKINDSDKCCVRLGLNKPLCSKRPLYRIKGKYFCNNHGQKHPNAKDADVIPSENNTTRLIPKNINQINERLERIEKDLNLMVKNFQYLLGRKEFREAVYAINEGKDSELLKSDKIEIRPLI